MPDDSPTGPDSGPQPAPPERRRRPLRVLLIVLGLLATLVVSAAAVGYVRFDGQIRTFSNQGLSRHRPPRTVAGQNILLIGSDSRAGADRRLGGTGTAVGRSDTTLLVHIYQGGTRAVAVSIPRDALVDIPPCLLPDGSWSAPQHNVMFNAAFSVGQSPGGNPACTVNTVEKLTRMRVDHTVIADFAGFSAMTRIVGGVRVCVPNTVYQGDLNPNLHAQGKVLFHQGLQTVAGPRALDYVRLRHGLGDGSDIGRMRRQQAFLGSVIEKVRADGLTPTHILPIAEAATKYLTFDSALGSADKLVSLVLSLRHMTPDDIVFVTTPWRYDGPRVALVHPDVDRLWAALQADQPVGRSANVEPRMTVAERLATVRTKVAVLNGTSVAGLAAETANLLRGAGVNVGAVRNTSAAHAPDTVVEYGRGAAVQARALASAFEGAKVQSARRHGLRLVLGGHHRMRSLDAVAQNPVVELPATVTDNVRSAASNPCSGIS